MGAALLLDASCSKTSFETSFGPQLSPFGVRFHPELDGASMWVMSMLVMSTYVMSPLCVREEGNGGEGGGAGGGGGGGGGRIQH